MALLSMQKIVFSFSGQPLLDRVNLKIHPGERVCLLGRNGEGKSTLIRLMHGEYDPDEGKVTRKQGLKTAILPQEVPVNLKGTVFEIVAAGLDKNAEIRQVDKTLSLMNLDGDHVFETLSAGMKRRVLLAKGLANEPDILLLDEPTNHLDLRAITWLEELLDRFSGAVFFVTHDRMFLKNLATRIVELDRGALTSWECDYETFLKRKEGALEAEAKEQEVFDKKLKKEEAWIRQGILARRTRNEGRVKALKKLREIRKNRRERVGTVRMQAQEAERTGRLVIETKKVSHAFDSDKPVIQDLSIAIMRQDKIGVMGPNGAGKTTLLKILLGQLKPSQGEVRHGTHIKPAYFDQLREQLEESQSVKDNVGDGSETITINGKSRHIMGYLQDFLFTPDRAKSPISFLSGGERNRVLLARLFSKPSNVLVLDEPTNDLDAETLELLEEQLIHYQGTALLVSHDRAFLNNVVTSTLVFEGEGVVKEYAGGYDDWLVQRKQDHAQPAQVPKKKPQKQKPQKKRLTYLQVKELDGLPIKIEALEQELKELHGVMADPEFYGNAPEMISKTQARFSQIQEELDGAYLRWEELEQLKG